MLTFPCLTWLDACQLFVAFLIGHALADFPLQGDFLALGKNRYKLSSMQDEKMPVQIWPYCMGAHCAIHAGAVWAVSGVFVLGLIEFALHWMIDSVKNAGWFGFRADQWAHILCKAAYVLAGLWMGRS